MKKWMIIPGFILLIATTVWAYTLQHTGPEIDQGVSISLDIGGTTGLIESDGANNISSKAPVTVVTPPGSDNEIPSEKAVVDYVEVSAAGEDNIGANAGAGAGVYRDKSGVTLNFKSLIAGGAISIVENPDTIEISTAGGAGEANTGNSLGTGEGTVYKDKTGVQLNFRSIRAGTNVTISEDANEITINAAGGGGGADMANVGTGEGEVFRDTTTTHNVRRIAAGANITIDTDTTTADTITIAAANPGETNTLSSVGAGEGTLPGTKVGEVLNIKSIAAGTGVTIGNNADNVTINAVAQPVNSGLLANIPATCSVGQQYVATDADSNGLLYTCVNTNVWKASPEVISGVPDPYTLWRDSDAEGPALEDQDTAIIEVNMETVTQNAEDGSWELKVMKNGTQTSVTSVNLSTNTARFGGTDVNNLYQINANLANLGYSGDFHSGLNCGGDYSARTIVTVNPATGTIVAADASAGSGLWPARGILPIGCTNGGPAYWMVKGYMRNDAWTLPTTAPGHLWLSTTLGTFETTDPHDGMVTGDAIQIIGHSIRGGAVDIAYFDFSRPYSNKK